MRINLKNAKQTVLGNKQNPEVPISRSKDVYHSDGDTVENILDNVVSFLEDADIKLSNIAPENYNIATSIGYDLNVPRAYLAGAGYKDQAIAFGGENASGISNIVEVNAYELNGVNGWGIADPMSIARTHLAGCGDNSDDSIAMAIGGLGENDEYLNTVEIFDFESYTWNSSESLPISLAYSAGYGRNTDSAIVFGGKNEENEYLDSIISYNGSAWSTSTAKLNIARYALAGCGNATIALAIGGIQDYLLPYCGICENINIRTMTVSTMTGLNEPRAYLTVVGKSSKAFAIGGENSNGEVGTIEKYNGIDKVWSITGYLSVAKKGLASCGTDIDDCIIFGGCGEAGYYGTTETIVDTDIFEHFNNDIIQTDRINKIYDELEYKAPTDYNTWSKSYDLNMHRRFLAGTGNDRTALAIGGIGSSSHLLSTELYNDSGWKTSGDLSSERAASASTSSTRATIITGALLFGGKNSESYIANTEKWSSDIWSTVSGADFLTPRSDLAAVGNNSSALAIGGQNDTGVLSTVTKYTSSTWSESGNINIGRYSFAAAGDKNSAIIFGGYGSSLLLLCEKYNIDTDTWAVSSTMNIGRIGLAGCGTTEAALAIGGKYGIIDLFYNITERYNGDIWYISGYTTEAKAGFAATGTADSALAFGGYSSKDIGSYTYKGTEIQNANNIFEHFNDAKNLESDLVSIKEKIDYKAPVDYNIWRSCEPMNASKSHLAGCGTADLAIAFGGRTGSNEYSATTEVYENGTWVEACGELTPKTHLAGCGTANFALAFGGKNNKGYLNGTELYDYENVGEWETVDAMLNTPRAELAGCGAYNADDGTITALAIGGCNNTEYCLKSTECYDGTTWSSDADLNIARKALAVSGDDGYAIVFGGASSGSSNITSEIYNGSWKLGPNLNISRFDLAGCGTSESALAIGGEYITMPSNIVENYNGDIWCISGYLIEAKFGLAAAGNSDSSLVFGGCTSVASADLTTKDTEIQNANNIFDHFNEFRDLESDLIGIRDSLAYKAPYEFKAWKTISNMSFNRQYPAGNTISSKTTALGSNGAKSTESYNIDDDTWITNSNLNAIRGQGTAAGSFITGGKTKTGSTSTYNNTTEKYSNSTWFIVDNGTLLTSRAGIAGVGSATKMLAVGGLSDTNTTLVTTEQYTTSNGWKTDANLNVARKFMAGGGFINNAMIFGGSNSSNTLIAFMEKYNGSSWKIGENLCICRKELAGSNSIAIGGLNSLGSEVIDMVESYNGTAWYTDGMMSKPRYALAYANKVAFGGSTVADTNGYIAEVYTNASIFDHFNEVSDITTEIEDINLELENKAPSIYNTWTISSATLNTARSGLAGIGDTDKAISIGGTASGTHTTIIERFDKDYSDSEKLWHTAGNIDIARSYLSVCGNADNFLAIGGENSNVLDIVEFCTPAGTIETRASLLTPRNKHVSCGSINDALVFGGNIGSESVSERYSEIYNGESWSKTANTNTNRKSLAGCGTSKAALAIGGSSTYDNLLDNYLDTCEKYSGSSWSSIGNLNAKKRYLAASGTVDSAIVYGGELDGSISDITEKYDGQTWSIGLSMNNAKNRHAGCGNANSSLAFGGLDEEGTASAITEYSADVNILNILDYLYKNIGRVIY